MVYPVIQFLRPDGRRRPLQFDVPPQHEELARGALALGYNRLEAEVLRTGMVSVTLNTDHEDADGEPVYEGPLLVPASENAPGKTGIEDVCIKLWRLAVANQAGR